MPLSTNCLKRGSIGKGTVSRVGCAAAFLRVTGFNHPRDADIDMNKIVTGAMLALGAAAPANAAAAAARS
jgi:hypothetical protein